MVGLQENAQAAPRAAEGKILPEFFNPRELAQYLNVSLKFVNVHIQDRRLPGMVRMGRYWRFRRHEVEKRLLSGNLLLEK